MVEITFNGEPQTIASIEDLGQALDRFDKQPQFELWALIGNGPRVAMVRNGVHAWLMYLRFDGDAGFVSQGDNTKTGRASYTLSNGQIDECPLSWCIDLERCYQAIAYFVVNEGARPDWVSWAKG
jgi:hypothetical protein